MVVGKRKHLSRILAGAWCLVVVSVVSGQPYKQVPPERSIVGVSADAYVAARDKLHKILTREMPEGTQNTRIAIKLTDAEVAGFQRPVAAAGVPLRVGTVKALSPALSVSGIVVPDGQLELGARAAGGALRRMDDGGFTWAVSIGSEGANGIRVHFKDFSLPESATMYFLNQEGEAYGPYTGRGRQGTGEFWTDSVFSETGVIMLRFKGPPSRNDLNGISFVIDSVGHIGSGFDPSPQGGAAGGGVCGNASCIEDANCFDVAPADQSAIAAILFSSGPGLFVCTGGLIADTDPGTQRNMFLTANHCISTGASAASMETYFLKTTTACGGSCPGNSAPHTTGATILDTSTFGDHTLMELSGDPPAGSTFLGWSNEPIANTHGAHLYRVSNPGFGPQVYSHHQVTTTSFTCGSLPRTEFIYSRDITGATDGGSSGSPVVNASGQIVGQLFGCCGSNCSNVCNSAGNATIDGALALYFPMVEEFLDPPEGGTCRLDELSASDAAADDLFAAAVAVDGDVIVAGAALSDGATSATGAAYVYRFDGSGWPQEQKLTADVPIEGDQLGNSVAVSGDVVIAGAHRNDDGGGNAGAAYVFRFNGASWSQEQELTASDAAVNDFFGRSVAVDGDVAVVGAIVDDCPDATANCGSAYVFRHAAGVWTQEQKLIASDGTTGDFFGVSVAIDGNVIVVGSQNADCAAGICGAVYVYRHDGATWVEESKLTAIDQATSDKFGVTVAVSVDLIAVGAPLHDCVSPGVDCGSAYVYRFDGASWDSGAALVAWDADEGDAFGGSVAVGDGVVVVGAKDDACTAVQLSCGTGYVFRFDGGEWVGDLRLRPLDRGADDQFGQSMALDGAVVVIGASRVNCADGVDCGAAYAFSVAGDCDDNGTDDMCEILDDPSLDLDLDGRLDACDCDLASSPAPDVAGIKNRFLSFTAGDADRLQAIRVRFVSLPAPYDLWNGAELWVGPTGIVSEAGGTITPSPEFPTFRAAVLQCEPFFTDWSLLGEVHATHEGIIPLGVYEIAVFDESCDSDKEADYSSPLVITNPKLGDTVANLIGVPPSPPDGEQTIDDVLGVLGRFSSVPGSISKSRADLEPRCVDLTVNVSDALVALAGFAGLPYPFSTSALDPCDSVCNIPVP